MIIKVRHTAAYAVISNELLQDRRLSHRARGLAAYLISLPADSRIDSRELATHSIEGRDAIRSALAELETCGYLHRETVKDKKGRFVYQAVLSDQPDAATSPVPPAPEKPAPDNPASGDQAPIKVNGKSKNRVVDESTPPTASPAGTPSPPGGAAPPSPHQQLMLVISAVLYGHSNTKLWTQESASVLGKAAKKFLDNGILASEVLSWNSEVWRKAWPGNQEGRHPTYTQMMNGVAAHHDKVVSVAPPAEEFEVMSLHDYDDFLQEINRGDEDS